MANLDSENKRRSATGLFHLYTVPKYDGGTDPVDREHVTFIYAGISPGSFIDPAPGSKKPGSKQGLLLGVY